METQTLKQILELNPFYGTKGRRDAPIMVVGEVWGEQEEAKKLPFVGASGKEFDRILAEAGVNPNDCFITNLVPLQPDGGTANLFRDGGTPLWGCSVDENVQAGLRALRKQVEVVQPRLIIALGSYAFWALCRECTLTKLKKKDGGHYVPSGITSWRGSMLYSRTEYGASIPVLPTLHPAYIMRSWKERVYLVHDLKERVPKGLAGDWAGPLVTRKSEPTFDEVIDFLDGILERADNAGYDRAPKIDLVCDIETKNRALTCIGFATAKDWAIAIPLVKLRDDRGLDSYWPIAAELEILERVRRLLLHPKISLIGQNFLYDMDYLNVWLVLPKIRCGFDTMCAHHTLFPGTDKGLDVLASLYCEHYVFWKNETQEWAATGTLQQMLDYNCTDTMRTFEIATVLKYLITALKKEDQWAYMLETIGTVFNMMRRGMNRSYPELLRMRSQIEKDTIPREKLLNSLIPQNWIPRKQKTPWYYSPTQTMYIFYEVLGLPRQYHKKTKEPTIDDAALDTLARKAPWLKLVFKTQSELRSLRVFRTLFLDAWLDPDGKMRTRLNPAGTETFRFSSAKNNFGRGANMQNISSGDE